MGITFNNNLDIDGSRAVVSESINDGHLGLGIWNITRNTLNLRGKITGVPANTYHSLPDFMEEFVHPKDRLMVLSDMNEWVDEKAKSVSSTFRIQTKNKQMKWALLKGKFIIDEKTKDELFYLIIYDVSGKNYQAGNDPQTNLLNSDFFIKKLKSTIDNKDGHHNFALIGISITNSQSLLDAYNSQFSAMIFEEVAALLSILLGQESELAKLSGKTYIGLVYDFKDENELEKLTTAIVSAFKESFFISGRYIRVEINIGVNTYPDESTDPMELLMFNEYATLQANKSGIYQTIFFTEDLKNTFHETLMIQRGLASAVQDCEFYLVYQPQVNSLTGQIIGVEVLARWHSETLGEVPPSQFIPVAEKSGYMVELGEAILEESIQTAKSWHTKGYPFGALSINVSPVELKSTQYIDKLISLCREHELPTHLVKLEITEGIYMESIKNSYEVLNKLIWHGFKIIVDDFGVGYSNLSFLARAEMDTLKIDKSLIDNIHKPNVRSVVQGIIYLANNLNYNLLAEGVETQEQVTILSEMGCHWIQGYYYSKPLKLEQMDKMLEAGFIN